MRKESIGHPIRGIARKLLLMLAIYIMSKDIQQDAEHENIVDKIEHIMDEAEDIAYRIRKLELLRDEPDNTEESPLEELKARLNALEGDEPYVSEFEEPVATRIDFEDEIFTFMSEIDLCEEDEQLIKIATNHPLYKSFAKTYRKHEPEASELQTVRAFVRTMAPQ